MKRIHISLLLTVAMMGIVSCSPSTDKTVANLKSAIDGESMASAKYAAYAERAGVDSLYAVQALFEATSAAEAIHAQALQNALLELGVANYVPTEPTFTVNTTVENLQDAINGQQNIFTNRYPQFIKDAEAEKAQGAAAVFTFTQDTEKGHTEIFTNMQTSLSAQGALVDTYLVCPKCGNMYAETAPDTCEFCQTPVADFVVFRAVVPQAN